ELLGSVFFGAAELQVLDQMRDAGFAEALVARPNLGEQVKGRNRRLMIFQHQNLEPVGQRFALYVVGNSSARAPRRGARNQRGKRKRQCQAMKQSTIWNRHAVSS